jgi:mono/diheme cytochrome c family protein
MPQPSFIGLEGSKFGLMKRALPFLVVVGLGLGLSACGSAASTTPTDLSPSAVEGLELSKSNGCASCHGSNFGGGIGPSWKGLSGTSVSLTNGETVIADRAYLVESIKNPGAKKVSGFSSPMPMNTLTDAEIEKIVDYIESLK